ncbi:MAG: alkaline phosphatase family protein [Planctomycetes bacterium]|nr:alkaline phosphatase family protein [Planctomycetota bacterium]
MKRFALALILCWLASFALAGPPRLVVAVSIDQFPYDYLERMRPLFSTQGMFLRFLNEGAVFSNCHHAHALTKTGPGHSVLLSGAFPGSTGIIDNDWLDRFANDGRGAKLYCVDDKQSDLVGTVGAGKGKSPRNMLVGTVGDVLKLSDRRHRVFGVALKDRASILMAGHAADAAYWFDSASGNWVTSTYYRNDLPSYLRVYNEGGAAKAYAGQTWNLLHPAGRYVLHYADDAVFEGQLDGSGRGFPHKLPEATDKKYHETMSTSPMGNDMTLAVARLLIEAEKLGRGPGIDLLCINLSSNDYVGHKFGPHSLEVQDMTCRTDLQLAELASFIGQQLGDRPWLMTLSSDHGVAPLPEYAINLRLPASRLGKNYVQVLQSRVEQALEAEFGAAPKDTPYVQDIDDSSVYLHLKHPQLAGAKRQRAHEVVRQTLLDDPDVAAAFTRSELASADSLSPLAEKFRRSFNWERSGDVLYAFRPYVVLGATPGMHGSPWAYDTHVPLLFWGHGIRAGKFTDRVSPAAMAPTLASLLRLPAPAGCEVESLSQAIQPATDQAADAPENIGPKRNK